jgi:hypothetical protein
LGGIAHQSVVLALRLFVNLQKKVEKATFFIPKRDEKELKPR